MYEKVFWEIFNYYYKSLYFINILLYSNFFLKISYHP